MISRRNFFVITLLMAAVLFLCMGLNNLKDSWNDYTVNAYTETAENYPSRVNIYIPGISEEEKTGTERAESQEGAAVTARDRVVCIGRQEALLMKVVKEWVAYTKRNMEVHSSLASCTGAEWKGRLPEMLVIDSACVNWSSKEELDFLEACVEDGIHLVFCTLPDVSVVQGSRQVRELLGIEEVRSEEVAVSGFHLREGFLLGGETIYWEEEEISGTGQEPGFWEEGTVSAELSFPGKRSFPWYLPASGTKVYMKGMLREDSVKAEAYPIVIWRKSFGTAYVFAVNGGFMDGIQAMGLLSAMSAEMYSYEIYPVLNAQNIILAGYPAMADENAEEMERIYSRSMKQVFQEIIFSGVTTVLQQCRYRASCMMTPQYDYTDNAEPDRKQFRYYLKVLNEQGAEVGLCARNRTDISADVKLNTDEAFFEDAVGGYEIVSFYADSMTEEEIGTALEQKILASARTVVRDYDEDSAEVIGFLSENVTAQSTLGDGMEYSYKNDFLVKSLETALGYFSVSFDMFRAAYPEEEGDRWEQMSQIFASNVVAYGKTFSVFERTTVSECDLRIRQLLALDYRDSRADDTVRLEVEGIAGPAWFVLRTHNEAVREMEGGSWQQLEEGAYLIRAEAGQVTIMLEPADKRHYQ